MQYSQIGICVTLNASVIKAVKRTWPDYFDAASSELQRVSLSNRKINKIIHRFLFAAAFLLPSLSYSFII